MLTSYYNNTIILNAYMHGIIFADIQSHYRQRKMTAVCDSKNLHRKYQAHYRYVATVHTIHIFR